MVGGETEAPPLCDGRDDEDQLHPGERLANALARSAAEGEIRELRQTCLERGRPTGRIEAIRIFEEPRIALCHPGAHQEDRAGGRYVAADWVRFDGASADEPGRRIESHRLGDD